MSDIPLECVLGMHRFEFFQKKPGTDNFDMDVLCAVCRKKGSMIDLETDENNQTKNIHVNIMPPQQAEQITVSFTIDNKDND